MRSHCWMIKVSLENDHEFINKEYSLYWCEAFWEAQSKAESLYSKWTISYNCRISYHRGESCSSNKLSESCPKLSRANRLVNFKCRTKDSKKKGVKPPRRQ